MSLSNKIIQSAAGSGGPEIELVGYSGIGFSGGGGFTLYLTSLTGGLDTSPSEGDLVIITIAKTTPEDGSLTPDCTVTSPAGYTNVVNRFANDSDQHFFGVNYKIQGATPDASVQVQGTFSSVYAGTAIASVWRGVDPTTPMDVTPVEASHINGALPNPPNITAADGNAKIVVMGGYTHREGVQTLSSGNATYPIEDLFQINRNNTQDANCAVGTRENAGAGVSTVTGYFAFSSAQSSTYSGCSAALALRPA